MKRIGTVAVCLFVAACAMKPPPGRPPVVGAEAVLLHSFAAPSCGGRVFVAMGTNHKFPTNPNLRIPEGELYLDGVLIDRVSSNPEFGVLDVPAGKVEISWMVSAYGAFDRSKTKQNRLLLNLADGEKAFVVLDWHDDTPAAAGLLLGPIGILATVGFRTEVAETRDMQHFAGKKAVFHRVLGDGACVTRTLVESSQAPLLPDLGRTSRYRASASQGTPAFKGPAAEGMPLHNFPNGELINVVDKLPNGWLRVVLPDGRLAYVPEAIVRAE